MGKPLFIAKQSGHPQGWVGHIVAHIMAFETAPANAIALEHLNVQPGNAVLEVGFGHGKTIVEIARRVPTATISGVDPSNVMVSTAQRKCRTFNGRVDLRAGMAAPLPFDNGSFDRAFSVHTTYFWPQLETGLREICRVLRADGRFVLGFRPADDTLAAASLPPSVYTLHSIEEMKSGLLGAGFSNVTVECNALKKGFMAWAICN